MYKIAFHILLSIFLPFVTFILILCMFKLQTPLPHQTQDKSDPTKQI
jgi:F0F1-type ATP synthase assembly protein I